MNGTSEVDFLCYHCGQMTSIFIEIESQSDYYSDNTCEHCNNEIKDEKLEEKIMEEVTDYLIGRADYCKD